MGVIEFFILVFILVGLGFITILGIRKLFPEHPSYIEGIVWFVVILIILVTLASAMGLTGYDPRIPRLR